MESEDKKMTKKGKAKQATSETLATIADDCDDVLDFLQAFAVKSPQVAVAPLSLCTEKRERVWFRHWTDTNLPTPPNLYPQDHMGLMVVLTNVMTKLHTAEALRPFVSAQH